MESVTEDSMIKDVAIEILTKEIITNSSQSVPITHETREENEKNTMELDRSLVQILCIEMVQNEKAKRTHKNVIIIVVGVFILLQFVMIFYTMNKSFEFIFKYYDQNKEIDQHLVNLLFGFLTGYITSVIVELIYLLKFIVKNVFDTSITDLIKQLKQ